MPLIKAFVADGALIAIDQRKWVEDALERQLNWEEIADSRQTAGSFFQADYEAEVEDRELILAVNAIAACRRHYNDAR